MKRQLHISDSSTQLHAPEHMRAVTRVFSAQVWEHENQHSSLHLHTVVSTHLDQLSFVVTDGQPCITSRDHLNEQQA